MMLSVAGSWPTIRFVARQSLNWAYVLPGVVGLWLAYSLGAEMSAAPGLTGLFCLIFGIAHAAMRLIDSDRMGRLDMLRLSGQSPGQLMTGFAIASAGPFIVAGMALLAWHLRATPITASLVVGFGVVLFGAVALSLLAVSLPRRDAELDSRIFALGLAIVALSGAVVQYQVMGLGPETAAEANPFAKFQGDSPLARFLVVAELAITAVCLIRVRRAFTRPNVRTAGRRTAIWTSNWCKTLPDLNRGVALNLVPAAVVGGIAASAILLLKLYFQPRAETEGPLAATALAFALFPLFAGAIAISSTARADVESGRFALLRTAPTRPWNTIAQCTIGYALPYVVVSAILSLMVLTVWGATLFPVGYLVLLLPLLAPVPFVEGWLRRWPLVYLLPVTVGTIFLAAGSNAGGFSRIDVARTAVVGIIPWLAATRLLARPFAPPLTGWAAVMTIVVLAAAIIPSESHDSISALSRNSANLAATILMMAALTVAPASRRAVDWFFPIMAGGFAAVVSAVAAGARLPDALLVSATTMSAWWAARRVHQAANTVRALSPALRVTGAFLLNAGVAYYWMHDLIGGRRPINVRDPAVFARAATQWNLSLAYVAVAAAVIIELAYRATTYVKARRGRVANPEVRPYPSASIPPP